MSGGGGVAAAAPGGGGASPPAAGAPPPRGKERSRRSLDCSAWVMFLLPYALLAFFAAVFFWARGSALAALADQAGASAPRFAAALARGTWFDGGDAAAAMSVAHY
jgi:glutathione S-transferase